jgi:hypothetical protein
LIERYFAGELECKTKNSHQFFLEKYEEPNGKEIEQLAGIRRWMAKYRVDQNLDVEKIKQEIKDQFTPPLTQTALYALGEHTTAQIIELSYGDMNAEFNVLLDNIAEL